jgi:hypothetical protein
MPVVRALTQIAVVPIALIVEPENRQTLISLPSPNLCDREVKTPIPFSTIHGQR